IGYGDVVEPALVETKVPVMLDLPAPVLRAYPPEAVIAEKFEAMVKLGLDNSRMKDFFDIWMLSREQSFSMARVGRAILTTFEHRQTPLPQARPTALTTAFLQDAVKVRMWKAFLLRIHMPEDHVRLEDVGEQIAAFVMPALESAASQGKGDLEWNPGGP